MIWNDEYETLPREALEALQLKRLRDLVDRMYARVPFYRQKLTEAGYKSGDIRTLGDLARLPFTTKDDLRDNYPFGLFAVPMDRGRPHPRLVGDDGQTHRGRVHPARHRHLVRVDGPDALRRGYHQPGHRPQRLRVRPLHRGAGRPLRRREDRGGRHPHVRREHQAADPDHEGLRLHHSPLHALLRPEHRRGDDGGGCEPGRASTEVWPLRGRALDRGDAPGDRAEAQDQARWTFTACPRSSDRASPRSVSRKSAGSTSSKITLSPRSSIPTPGKCCRTGKPASWSSPRSPKRPFPFCGIERGISRGSTPRPAVAGGHSSGWSASLAGRTTC